MENRTLHKEERSVAVVVASPFPANHGTPAGIREVSHEISQRGIVNHIVTYPIGDGTPVNGMKIHRIHARVKDSNIHVGPSFRKIIWDILLIVELCRVIRSEKIDLIHAHNYEGALVGYIAKLLTGKPLIYNAVNTMIDELPTYNFIKPRFVATAIAHFFDYVTPRTADHIIAISQELITFFQKKGIKHGRMTYIPLGINADNFAVSDASGVRKRFCLEQKYVIMYAGTLDEFQRVDYLLRAFSMVVLKHPDAVLMLVTNIANGVQSEKYQAMARELNIEKNTIFVDEVPLDELPLFLAAADVTVLPRPHCPGFPVKLLNYMAARKPIVTFAGSAKGLVHMEHAFVVSDGDWQGMSEGINMLIEDKEAAARLSRNGFDFLVDNYDLKTIAQKILTVYDRLSGYN